MEREPRRGDRDGGAGAGDLHADAGLPARLRGVRRQAQSRVRRRLMDRFAHYDWPFFEPRQAQLAREADAWCAENLGYAHGADTDTRSEEHTSELQSRLHLVCRLLLEKKK